MADGMDETDYYHGRVGRATAAQEQYAADRGHGTDPAEDPA
jgi:hypothetical protein